MWSPVESPAHHWVYSCSEIREIQVDMLSLLTVPYGFFAAYACLCCTRFLVKTAQLTPWVQKNPRAEAGLFDLNYNPSRPTVTFDVPTKTQQVILSALITGGRENTHISQTSGKQLSGCEMLGSWRCRFACTDVLSVPMCLQVWNIYLLHAYLQ